jgi:hypothetical protein
MSQKLDIDHFTKSTAEDRPSQRNQPNQTKPTQVSTNHVRVHAAHNREHDCYNNFILCRGCTHSS